MNLGIPVCFCFINDIFIQCIWYFNYFQLFSLCFTNIVFDRKAEALGKFLKCVLSHVFFHILEGLFLFMDPFVHAIASDILFKWGIQWKTITEFILYTKHCTE